MLSVVIPFHADGQRLAKTLSSLRERQSDFSIKEVLLCHNGPHWKDEYRKYEATEGLAVKVLHTDTVGLGAGCKLGLAAVGQPYALITGSDLPFGFTDLERWQALAQKPDIAIGSKFHSESQLYNYGFARTLNSQLFWLLRRILLGPTPKDTQGSLILRADVIRTVLPLCELNDYLFTMEFITLALRQGKVVQELPVELLDRGGTSSVSVARDSTKAFVDLLSFARRIKNRRDV